jgi:hypothetical protein
MSHQSSFFNPEAFLLPFTGREEILDAYVNSLPAALVSLGRPVTSATAFLAHLQLCPANESRVLIAGMKEAWEMCSDESHERLLNVLQLAGQIDGYCGSLPAECLALHLLVSNRAAFESAITLDEVKKCDALELFKPCRQVALVHDLDAAMNHFRSEMAARCQEKYGSSRILLRRFNEAPVLRVGFFFEKPPKALRVLDGDDGAPNLARNELRPTQFDAVMFEPETGVLSIRSGWGRLTDPIRRAFAAAFLGDPDVYEWPGSTNILNLAPLVDLRQDLEDADGGYPIVSELEYALLNDPEGARYKVNAKDLRRVIGRDNTSSQVADASIRKVVVKMAPHGPGKRRRVALKYPNRVEFRRGSETSRILSSLNEWGVFNAPVPPDIAA